MASDNFSSTGAFKPGLSLSCVIRLIGTRIYRLKPKRIGVAGVRILVTMTRKSKENLKIISSLDVGEWHMTNFA